VCKLDSGGSNHRQIAVSKKKEVTSVVENCGNIRCNKVFILPKSNHSRRSITSRNNLVCFVGADHYERENSRKLLYRLAYGIFEGRTRAITALQRIFDEMCDDLSVGLG